VKLSHNRQTMAFFLFCIFCLFVLTASQAFGVSVSGYSEYYVPGDEDSMSLALRSFGTNATNGRTHAQIVITAWSDDVQVYYDHWEDGLDFDKNNPLTADETFTLATAGTVRVFDDTPLNGIVIPRNLANTYYDGRDHIYVAGGEVTVTRSSWLEDRGRSVEACSWEIYPVKPQLKTYISPFGENLSGTYADFIRTFVLIQATENNTTFTVDLNHDGTPDKLDRNFDGDTNDGVDTTVVTLQAGESFFLGNVPTTSTPLPPFGARATVNSGMVIDGSSTLQVKFIVGDPSENYEARGISAFPRGYWTTDYYAPVDEPTNGTITDIFLYNPNASTLTISWETRTTTGSFTINAGATRSFRNGAGAGALPEGGGVYLSGDGVFWGVSTIDSTGPTNEWAYSLLPTTLLYKEHYLGSAPGGADGNDSGVFLTVVQDNTTVFVDRNNDGTVDYTYNLDRLETQYITDTVDGDLSGARFWATGEYTMAYGQNPDTAPAQATSGDLGYVCIPGEDFIDLVLKVRKNVNPPILAAQTIGEEMIFTLEISSFKYTVDGIEVTDTLSAGWEYVEGNTVITRPDGTDVTGATADDGNSTGDNTLTWSGSDVFGSYANLAENQIITITFTARTTVDTFLDGDLSRNEVSVWGQRTVGGVTQDFRASDFAFVTYGDAVVGIVKTTGGTDPLSPGDTFTYSVVVSNPATAASDLTSIAIYDALPQGVTYVDGTSAVSTGGAAPTPIVDFFDFESGDQGFTTGTADGTGAMNWERGNPATVSPADAGKCGANCNGGGPDDDHTSGAGVNCWGTDLDDLYSNDIDAGIFLYSPTYDFSQMTSVEISYWEWLEIEGENYDEAYFQYNIGSGWVDIFVLDNEATRTDTAWSQYTENAAAYAAGESSVQWRWYINSDWGWQWGGWYIDDVSVKANGRVLANDPPNFVSSGDGYSLSPGGSLTLTFDVTVDDPLATGIDTIVNEACVTTNEISLSICDDVQNITLNSSTESGTVGNRIWLDTDGDGVEDVGESGLAGIEVTLKNEYGTPLLTATTDSNGYYLFSNVAFDSGYYVEITSGLPSGLTQTTDSRTDDRTGSFDLGGASTTGSYRDEFGSRVYDGYVTGTIDWSSSPWIENDNDGGGATSGNIFITTDGELSISMEKNGDEDHIRRSFNIPANADSATLSFDWRTSIGVDTGDWIILDISTDGGSLYTILATYTGFAGVSTGQENIDLTAYASASDRIIRFRTDTYTKGDEDFYVDDFDITYTVIGEPVTEYLDADIGYQPDTDTAIIGDRVWSDADGDGFQDAGEPGFGGILVRLYTDSDGDGVIDGSETYVETTTAADGSYQFTGVTATGSQDYIVYIDETQTALSAYDITTAGIYSIIDAADEGSYLNNDFGFVQNSSGTTHSIKDRVWLDNGAGGGTTNNGIQDGSESGIANVTVVLRDNSNNIIALTTTDANGDFAFTGVPDDVRYSWEATDQNSVLTDYYGTTTSAQDGDYQMPGTLTADIDFMSPLAPNFGYNVSRSIGDFVWNDSDGDGVQDAGESGIAGVTVQLYLDDDGTTGLDTSTDTYIGETTTDGYGKYMFAGLDDDDYIAHIAAGQSVLSNFTRTTIDDDTSASGDQQSETITSGASNLNADFGYEPNIPVDISGRIWDDVNQDGDDESGGEDGFEIVTVQLFDGTDLIAEVDTDANGYYSFNSVPGNTTYTVKITDTNGVLNGYSTTYEKTEGATDGTTTYNDQETVVTTTVNVSDIDFGYYKSNPTYVVLSYLTAYASNGQVIVEWETVAEIGTRGFNLLRQDLSGKFKKLNPKPIPAVIVPHGGLYQVPDPLAVIGETYVYQLEEILASGGREVYGPYTITIEKGLQSSDGEDLASESDISMRLMQGNFARKLRDMDMIVYDPTYKDVKNESKSMKISKKSVFTELKASSRQQTLMVVSGNDTSEPNDEIKIMVSEPGFYWVGADTIADIVGVEVDLITGFIGSNHVRMSNMGSSVDYLPAEDNSGIYFYGESFTSIYTDVNVYWIQLSPSAKGDVNGDRITDLADLVIGLNVLASNSVDVRSDYAASGADVNGNNQVDLAEVVYILNREANIGHNLTDGMGTVETDVPTTSGEGKAFTVSEHFEEETWWTSDVDIATEDFWFWEQFWSGAPNLGISEFPIDVAGVAVGDFTAELTVNLQGLSNHDHQITLTLNAGTANEQLLGPVGWNGFDAKTATFKFAQEKLFDGANTINIQGMNNGDGEALGLDSFDLAYQKMYVAIDSRLVCNSSDNDVITISGFTGADIALFEISDPLHPKQVTGFDIDAANGKVTFVPSAENIGYLGADLNTQKEPDAMIYDEPSDLRNEQNSAQYIVITADELAAGAQSLAAYRETRGLSTMVVTLTNVFDEFSDGIYDPFAIRNFIAFALSNWASAPQYVVLVGHGSYDFKEVLAAYEFIPDVDNLIPVVMVNTPYGLYGSDSLYSDVDGDGLADIALGRIPAKTNAEVEAVVAKIEAYELSLAISDKHVLMVADNPDSVSINNFPADSDNLAALVSADYTVDKIYYPGLSKTQMQNQFVTSVNSDNGAFLVNYIGHGGYDRMSDFFAIEDTVGDQNLLSNSQYPIYLALTCLVGGFDYPLFDSLGEVLMLKDGSGAIAIWAPSGLSINSEAVKMNQELFSVIFMEAAGDLDLGHAVKQALENYNSNGPVDNPNMLRIYNLLGDPALKVN
jgi:hypothetical protein